MEQDNINLKSELEDSSKQLSIREDSLETHRKMIEKR